ncbi:MAG: cell wall hydrolase, partial [Clostridia bacterium]|nr:cell wall hydrolase [Clostridia bacterium]
VLSASLILVLAVLVSPVHFPVVRALQKTPSFTEMPSAPEKASAEQEQTKTTPIPAKADLSVKPGKIYSAPDASFSKTVYGLDKESASGDARGAMSSVLAVNQSVPNFTVTASVSQEEYDLILYCVGHETRSGSLPHKVLITEVIFNRVQGPGFGSTVKDVILSPGQFDVMVNYEGWGDWFPDETTLQAVNLVLSGSAPDYSEGALYFCNPYIVGEGNWFDMTRPVVCEIEGHRFYR